MSEEMEKNLEQDALSSAETVSDEVLSDAENLGTDAGAGAATENENAHWYVVHT